MQNNFVEDIMTQVIYPCNDEKIEVKTVDG